MDKISSLFRDNEQRVENHLEKSNEERYQAMAPKYEREQAALQGQREELAAEISKSVEMSRNVQSGNTQNLKGTVIQRSFPKWSVAERRKTAAASDQAAVCACAHSRYFTGGSPSGLRV